ncbi:MAG: dolichyl-phosphate-mannose--protein mannosyltransferase [Tannerella sp.]|jgi:4-amino-4-deoxy-L-arabinose transferase-like glycosyltransferase|nr:dolichyl-phosphate-mannose--protein mannosyltransferase [Tannerella sp.]
MRTSALQYLYLQKPISSIILICLLSVIPWILNGVYTAEDIKNTEVATTILESGNWVLPEMNSGKTVIQPPMLHWLIAICSLPQGHVSVFSTHIPSAVAYVVLMVFVLLFFGRHIRFQETFITTLLLITSLEVHWAGITLGGNIIYTAFVVIGLFKMFRWENKLELKGLPIIIPIMLSGAILTKGFAGIVYPLLIFGFYLFFLHKYSLFKILKVLFYVGLTSLFVPTIWYVEGWRQGGAEFLQLSLLEDIRSLINVEDFRKLFSPIIGFLPWTLLLFCSLFGLNKNDFISTSLIEKDEEEIHTRRKIKLFSSIAAIAFVFLTFLSGKSSFSDFLPAYPFIAVFMAMYVIYLTENKSYVIRIFAGILSTIVCLTIVVIVLMLTNLIDFTHLVSSYFPGSDLEAIKLLENAVSFKNLMFIILFVLMLISLITTCYQMMKKINLKILYATIFLIFCSYLFIDGIIMGNMLHL